MIPIGHMIQIVEQLIIPCVHLALFPCPCTSALLPPLSAVSSKCILISSRDVFCPVLLRTGRKQQSKVIQLLGKSDGLFGNWDVEWTDS